VTAPGGQGFLESTGARTATAGWPISATRSAYPRRRTGRSSGVSDDLADLHVFERHGVGTAAQEYAADGAERDLFIYVCEDELPHEMTPNEARLLALELNRAATWIESVEA